MSKVRLVASEEQLRHCFSVRTEVFVEEQGVPPELEVDEADRSALHALVMLGGEPAGTARLLLDTPLTGHAKIGRVAVRSSFRGRGLATELMRFLEDLARREQQSKITLDAQLPVIPLYEKLCYRAYGPVFDDAGIDHRKMSKTL